MKEAGGEGRRVVRRRGWKGPEGRKGEKRKKGECKSCWNAQMQFMYSLYIVYSYMHNGVGCYTPPTVLALYVSTLIYMEKRSNLVERILLLTNYGHHVISLPNVVTSLAQTLLVPIVLHFAC